VRRLRDASEIVSGNAKLTTPPSAGAAQRAPIETNVVSLNARFIVFASSPWAGFCELVVRGPRGSGCERCRNSKE
jgi:hypothetical protein